MADYTFGLGDRCSSASIKAGKAQEPWGDSGDMVAYSSSIASSRHFGFAERLRTPWGAMPTNSPSTNVPSSHSFRPSSNSPKPLRANLYSTLDYGKRTREGESSNKSLFPVQEQRVKDCSQTLKSQQLQPKGHHHQLQDTRAGLCDRNASPYHIFRNGPRPPPPHSSQGISEGELVPEKCRKEEATISGKCVVSIPPSWRRRKTVARGNNGRQLVEYSRGGAMVQRYCNWLMGKNGVKVRSDLYHR